MSAEEQTLAVEHRAREVRVQRVRRRIDRDRVEERERSTELSASVESFISQVALLFSIQLSATLHAEAQFARLFLTLVVVTAVTVAAEVWLRHQVLAGGVFAAKAFRILLDIVQLVHTYSIYIALGLVRNWLQVEVNDDPWHAANVVPMIVMVLLYRLLRTLTEHLSTAERE